MSKSLDEIRKKLQALDIKSQAKQQVTDKLVYPHWDIPEGTSSIVRFIPDANPDNTFFWVERQLFKLPFPGIKGHDENKPVLIQTPCIEMWNGKNSCPILNEVRPMWKDEGLKATASKYWIKKTYFMQGFVKTDPLNESDAPENPIRKFVMGPQIFAIIKSALLDPDMETSPVDYINGTDFIISKTSKGGYADYGTSKWARKESSISEEMMNGINQYGAVDLSTYLPKKPTDDQLNAMFEMFQASLDGELYDPERWGQFYRPYGFNDAQSNTMPDADESRTNSPSSSQAVSMLHMSSAAKSTPVHNVHVDVEEQAGTKSTAKASPAELVAMIRARNKQQ